MLILLLCKPNLQAQIKEKLILEENSTQNKNEEEKIPKSYTIQIIFHSNFLTIMFYIIFSNSHLFG